MDEVGRLCSRPSSTRSRQPWPPGRHRLPGAALLLVPERPDPQELLVFFHGAGGSATSGLGIVEALAAARGLLVLLPSSTGRTWDLILGGLGPDVAALDERLGQVLAAYDVRRVALAGFSDGGSYAVSLGVANGDFAEQVLAFSPGFLAPPQQVGRPRAWVSHGTADRVLPVESCGRRVVAQLRSAGYEVTYHEFEGGHVVTDELVAEAAADWLDRE